MNKEPEETPSLGREARAFRRIEVPILDGFEVAFGQFGQRPAPSTPVNISRGGLQTRTGVRSFEGKEGSECLIRISDQMGRVIPDRVIGRVLRVDRSRGYFLVTLEFTHPLERISM